MYKSLCDEIDLRETGSLFAMKRFIEEESRTVMRKETASSRGHMTWAHVSTF